VTVSCDVLVVGGGLIGAAAALGVGRSGRSVILVDEGPAPAVEGRFTMDIRNVACSPASASLLEELGVWPALARAPYRRMVIWEEQGTAELTFSAEDVGRDELGWILPNGTTVAALWSEIARCPEVSIVSGAVKGLSCEADRVRLDVGDGVVNARLAVGVDGARSTVRALAGVGVEQKPTGHHALATMIRTEQRHHGTALQRFLLEGPLALLPSVADDVVSVVWSQPPDHAAARKDMDDDAFLADIERASERRLGRVLEVDRRLTFPLAQHVVDDFNPADRVLLIGDAARVLHPLAGLGANVGFEDVRDLLARLAGLPVSADPGAAGLWRAFARKRRIRAQLMTTAMTGFRTVYAEGAPLPQWLRNSAVQWLDGARPLKRQIIREALGIGPLAAPW
jgi:2-octaprenylphenol hydroxylase